MHLWNDYEGKTLAGRTLSALLRPEGRSALFALAGDSEKPSIIRITESINDEGQMLATWRRLGELKSESLLSITDFGETTFEGTPLTYAVLEPTDATLSDLLNERAMSQPEAVQLATSVAAGIAALHAANLVHEHIDAANVFAVGEDVKLRADCVRECVVDNEFVTAADRARLIQQDTHDFGTMLLRALTLEKKLRPGLNLPGPFDRIVPRAIDGTWSMAEISKILMPLAPRVAPAAKVAAAAAPASSPASVAAAVPPSAPPAPGSTAPAAVAAALSSAAAETTPQSSLPYPEPATAEPAAKKAEPETAVTENPLLFQRRIQVPTVSDARRLPRWAPVALAAALLVALALYIFHGSSAAKPQTSVLSTPATQPSHPAPSPAQTAAAAPRQVAQAEPKVQPVAAAKHVEPGWYVIAYTFNHEEQALKRAAAMVQRYPGLHPQVIAPNGNAYMIALGGAMSRNEAEATLSHARRVGLPRDTFVRNYGS